MKQSMTLAAMPGAMPLGAERGRGGHGALAGESQRSFTRSPRS